MEIKNDILNNKIEIIIKDKEINVENIEKIERKLFSLSKEFKIIFKLKNGESVYEKYDTLKELHEDFEKLVNEAGFNYNGNLYVRIKIGELE